MCQLSHLSQAVSEILTCAVAAFTPHLDRISQNVSERECHVVLMCTKFDK